MTEYRLVIYEPRWHGWAMWALEAVDNIGDRIMVHRIYHGWMRRPRGSKLEQYRFDRLTKEYPR